MIKTTVSATVLAVLLSSSIYAMDVVSEASFCASGAAVATQSVMGTTRDSLRRCRMLLGETDETASLYVPGGIENISAQDHTLIGRTYELPVFGTMTRVATLYDRNGKVNVVTIPLPCPKADGYRTVLRELYGKPTQIQTIPSEGGATWDEWTMGKTRIRLYQEYELSALELTRVYKEPAERGSWIPVGTHLIYSEKTRLQPLGKAIIEHYGIPVQYRPKTTYAYNYVDLNGRPFGARAIIMRQCGGGMTPVIVRYTSHDGEYEPEIVSDVANVIGKAILVSKNDDNTKKLTLPVHE